MAKLERSCVDVTRHETAHIHRGGSRGGTCSMCAYFSSGDEASARKLVTVLFSASIALGRASSSWNRFSIGSPSAFRSPSFLTYLHISHTVGALNAPTCAWARVPPSLFTHAHAG